MLRESIWDKEGKKSEKVEEDRIQARRAREGPPEWPPDLVE